ncbi:hypothetical protein [Peribacillus asahii]|uniref:hypothetical protein n=1 Tax=Peribacillus asahii TaxID=228899 RepID=UPI00207A9077|nr:hypothetical protein [Peribacillus asahii]USK59193.1 hypothetical protein LIT37_18760 [Peribacillus asahii]
MKKVIYSAALVSLLLAGCGSEEVKQDEAAPAPTKVKEPSKAEVKLEITFAEFDKKYERDPEYDSYPDGLFQLKDGTKLNADYISYVDDDGFFDYASAIFYDGKLANLKIETTKSAAEVEAGLGIKSTDGVKIDPTRVGFEITFDDRFATDNIDRFSNEWD